MSKRPGIPREPSVRGNPMRQFRLSHLIVAVTISGVFCCIGVQIDILTKLQPYQQEIASLCVGLIPRCVGWISALRLGKLTRHLVAWFFATLGCAAAIIAANYDSTLGRLEYGLGEGLGAVSLIFGMCLAIVIETPFIISSLILLSLRDAP